MKKVKSMSKKLIAILLSAAMTFTPMVQSMPVYAAEVETQSETENLGTMPEADELENAVSDDVSDDGDAEEAAGEEQAPNDADADGAVKDDDVSDDNSKEDAVSDDDSKDDEKDADAGKVEENTEEKTETKTEAKEDTETKETVSDPVYEEVMEEESESASGSEEESESESEEMSLEEVRAAASVSGVTENDIKVGGWNESIYAEIAKVKGKDNMSAITEVSWTGAATGALTAKDLEYLVRPGEGGGARIDIPGLKEGTYNLTINVNGSGKLTKTGIKVQAYDRSGFAHFGYNGKGVGAYNDDGTLKNNAVVLYVNDDNKNDVTLTAGGVTVKGIGNILNSVGKDTGSGTTSNGGTPNTNQGVIQKLASEGKPLVVRFIGTVSESGLYDKGKYTASHAGLIDGLTDYDSTGNGGTVGDNGHMARIQSGKDLTLEGIGYDATIDGWGFHFISEGAYPQLGESFEVRNLTFINTPEDAVGMEGQQESKNASSKLSSKVERCWIHNNEFYSPSIVGPAESDKSEGDGSVDFKRGEYFTCSYNYFEACHKTNLVGSADYSLQFNLTYHHNYWYMCKARGPLARRANIHMYNNIVEMQTDYAQNTRADAYIFSEYNLFYACKSPQAVEGGAIKSYNDSISSVIWNKGSAGTVVTDKSTYVPNNCQFQAEGIKYDKFDVDRNQSYIPDNDYILQTDFKELRKVIVAQTGVMEQQPRQPEAVVESEYSVIPRLGDTVNQINSLPQTLTPGKISSKKGYVFSVNAPFNIAIKYTDVGVLVNAEGENLLEGNGELVNLPAGTYMIQAVNFQPGDPSKGTIATFKNYTIESITLEAFDTSKHYHNWVKNASESVTPTCTDAGKDVYDCVAEGCTEGENTKEEVVPALGHNYVWKTDKAATAEETGLKHEECTRCGDKRSEGTVIPAGGTGGGTGTGGDTGTITDAGDYVITFPNKKPSQDGDFFTLTNPAYKNSGTATVNGEVYNGSLAFSSKPQISFNCNDGATLLMVFDSGSAGKKVEIDGEDHTIGSDGIIKIEGLAAGKHVIARGAKNTETLMVYMSVTNAAPKYTYYNVSFVYNDDDGRDDVTVQLAEGTSFATMEALVPASFQKNGYILKGLYKDAECSPEQAVEYPYVVLGDADLYADWEVDNRPVVKMYSLTFDSNGGSNVPDVRIAENQIYTITQRPTKDGYAFAGWYDAAKDGNLVEIVDGSKLTGTYTVYAHWNVIETVKHELNCSSLNEGDITEKTTINGFTIHALAGEEGGTKRYMTVKSSKLYTNGLRISDTSISGNEDGMLKSIEFTAEASGYLTVEVELSGTSEAGKRYELVLVHKDKDGKWVEDGREIICSGNIKDSTKTKSTKEFDVNGAGTYYLYPEGDKGVAYTSLKFTEQTFTVLYRKGNGTTQQDLKSTVVRAGDVLTLDDCVPADGYTFKGWSVDNGATTFKNSYTVNADDVIDGVITITAVYDAHEYTIKYDVDGGSLPVGTSDTAKVKTGDVITLPVCTPAAGKKFIAWELKGSMITDSYSVNPADADNDGTITLKAIYAAEGDNSVYYTVILDTDGGTLAEGGGLERLIKENEAIKPGDCVKPGYVFKAWTVDGEDVKMPYTVTKDVTLKARYGLSDDPNDDPKPSDRTGIYIEGLQDKYEYTGDKIIPDFDVVDYGTDGVRRLLSQGVDYTVTYKNNKEISIDKKAEIIIKGKGNYTTNKDKMVTATFEIVAVTGAKTLVDLKGAKLTEKIQPFEYDGEFHYPDFKLTLGDKTTQVEYKYIDGEYKKNGKDDLDVNIAVSNNKNKGNATILVTGADGTNGKPTTVKIKFKITPASLAEATVTVQNKENIFYSPNGASPEVTVTIGSGQTEKTLKKGKDYTVKYAKNKAAGEATVTVTGKGNYTKKANPASYMIKPAKMSDFKVKAVTAYEGIKVGKIKATVVDGDENALKPNQYTLEYYTVNKAADDTRTKGTLHEDLKLELEDGAEICVIAVAKDDKNLVTDVDADKKTAEAFFVAKKDIAKAKFTIADDFKKGIPYEGKPVNLEAKHFASVTYKDEPNLVVSTDNGKTGDYIIVSCSNNVNKGTATAVIKGVNKYSGTKTIKYKIGQKTINDNVTLSDRIKAAFSGLFN